MNHYETLDLSLKAPDGTIRESYADISLFEIRAAHRRKVKEAVEAEDRSTAKNLEAAHRAYDVLGNAEKRKSYDEDMAAGTAADTLPSATVIYPKDHMERLERFCEQRAKTDPYFAEIMDITKEFRERKAKAKEARRSYTEQYIYEAHKKDDRIATALYVLISPVALFMVGYISPVHIPLVSNFKDAVFEWAIPGITRPQPVVRAHPKHSPK